MPRNYKRKLGARSYIYLRGENLKKAVKACGDEGLSIRDVCDLHGVKRRTVCYALKGKHQNALGEMTVSSQTEELTFDRS